MWLMRLISILLQSGHGAQREAGHCWKFKMSRLQWRGLNNPYPEGGLKSAPPTVLKAAVMSEARAEPRLGECQRFIIGCMILVIDNYDSFTYNLVQYLGQCGAEVVVRRNDQIDLDEILSLKPA